jgi:hypothetical protein
MEIISGIHGGIHELLWYKMHIVINIYQYRKTMLFKYEQKQLYE